MSFILDALRKSESERQRGAAPALARTPIPAIKHRTPAWVWILIGVLSLTVISLAVAWWRSDALPAFSAPPGLEALPIDRTTEPRVAASSTLESGATTATLATTDPLRLHSINELAAIEPGLPDYRLEVVAYNGQDAESSSAWINGRRYFVGERIGSGPVLIEVQPDSVVLAYGGSRYLLTTR